MPVTLMALYRRPEGGDEAFERFLRRYGEEHLPLVRAVPGLRSLEVERVARAYGETDLVMIARMRFDDRAALDAGFTSDQMRAAGRVLREIAPAGMSTVLVMESDLALGGLDLETEGVGGGRPPEGQRTSVEGEDIK